jgi:hypothetical protein
MLFVRLKAITLLLIGLVEAPCGLAQKEQTPIAGEAATGMTLHVTVRELQVAALVLDGHRHVVSDLDPTLFRLQIARRKPFPPMRIHRQGDDPFTLAVVMDVSRQHRFDAQLPDALALLRETALLPHDRLLLSAVNCQGVAYRGDTSTPDNVRKGTSELLASPKLHETLVKGRERPCDDQVRLLDGIAYALNRVAGQPGRHAVLVVSDGFDAGSITRMNDLEDLATNAAATVFVQPSVDMSGPNVRRSSLDPLVMISGGVVLDQPGKDELGRSFQNCVAMLRERFILGFNQPSNLHPGHNDLHVTVYRASYDVRASGVTAPNAMPVSDKAQPDGPEPPPGVQPGQATRRARSSDAPASPVTPSPDTQPN